MSRLTLAGVLLLCGCGTPSVLVPVSGRVTLNGKPIANVHVEFAPVAVSGQEAAGYTAVGLTDADGSFTLVTKDAKSDRPGAVVGKHLVRFMVKGEGERPGQDFDGAQRPIRMTIPARYSMAGGLDYTVPTGGQTNADFALTSP